MSFQHKPYSQEEDEMINRIMENRGSLSQRKALASNSHLLPGRTTEGALSRYKWITQQEELRKIREKTQRNNGEQKQQNRKSRAGEVQTPWTEEEEALLWNAVQTRPSDRSLHAELKDVAELLPGRTASSCVNRYYFIKNRIESEEAFQGWPPLEEDKPVAPPEEPREETPVPPAVTYYAADTKGTAGTPVVDMTPVEATPRLAEKAEEFIRSLYGVVEENAALRKQVGQLQTERAANLGRIQEELDAERKLIARLRKQISELEEDRDSFLRLMDKARVIGREESGI